MKLSAALQRSSIDGTNRLFLVCIRALFLQSAALSGQLCRSFLPYNYTRKSDYMGKCYPRSSSKKSSSLSNFVSESPGFPTSVEKFSHRLRCVSAKNLPPAVPDDRDSTPAGPPNRATFFVFKPGAEARPVGCPRNRALRATIKSKCGGWVEMG